MNKTKEFLQALGAMAEMAGFMLKELMANGFKREEAVSICSQYFITLATAKPDRKEE